MWASYHDPQQYVEGSSEGVFRMKPVVLLLAGLMMAGPVFTVMPAAAATPGEIIAARQANQKRVGDLMDSIQKALPSGATAASQLAAAKEIDERAHLIKGYFPPGTETGGNTKALPAIWADRAGFNKAADNYTAAFDKLLALAQAGDTAGFTAQFAAAGAACGACHRTYRTR